MKMESEVLDNGITMVTLEGRLDVEGAGAIDVPFTSLTASKQANILVDMANVSFIASIGMRTLLSAAKAQDHRGGRMVLANTQSLVNEALTTAGINTLIPMHDSTDAAVADLLG